MTMFAPVFFLSMISVVDAGSVRSRGSIVDAYEDVLADFKNNNLLNDNFGKTPLQIQEGQSLSFGGSPTFSLDNLQSLPSVFTSNAHYFLDGKEQATLPPNTLYSPSQDANVWVFMNEDTSVLEGALRTNPTTGETTALLPMDKDLQVFAEVESTDVDPEKLSRFHYSKEHNTRNLQELLDQHDRDLQWFGNPNLAPPPCDSFRVIQVAIAYESRFCQIMGGASRANQVVQVTVAQASQKFQRSNLCTKLELSHLEGHCNPKTDPYHKMFSGSSCNHNDPTSTIQLFADYWVENRQAVERDVTHLFHGFRHASGTIGCAWAGGVCDKEFGYGINELTFGGNNNPTFWTKLFAHELGHSVGAPHERGNTQSLMDASYCLRCNEFSDTSVAYMSLYMSRVDCLEKEEESDPGSAGNGGLTPPSTSAGGGDNADTNVVDTDTASSSSNNNGWGSGAVCSDRLGFCNLGPCCDPWQCYNRFICL